MLLLALAIAPGLAIIWYVYHKDSYDKEPKKYLFICFLLGILSTLPAIIIQLLAKTIFGDLNSSSSIPFYLFNAFVIVGCSEELSKFTMLRLYAYPKQSFNEPFDGIMYSVMVAMGFATLENIGYVQQHGISTAIIRMFLSVPAHAAFGVITGYYVGLAKFNKEKAAWLMLKGILLAILFHGAFDFFLFLQDSLVVKPYIRNGLLLLGAIGCYYMAVRLSLRSIHLHRELSRIHFEKKKQGV
jgi:RsiW-degrading membrane proteinase PrsW (M82 family)